MSARAGAVRLAARRDRAQCRAAQRADPACDRPLHRRAVRRARRRIAERRGGSPCASPARGRLGPVRPPARRRPGARIPAVGDVETAGPARPGGALAAAAGAGAGPDRGRRVDGRPAVGLLRGAGPGSACDHVDVLSERPDGAAPSSATSTRRTREGWPGRSPAPGPSRPTPPGWPRSPAAPACGSTAAGPRTWTSSSPLADGVPAPTRVPRSRARRLTATNTNGLEGVRSTPRSGHHHGNRLSPDPRGRAGCAVEPGKPAGSEVAVTCRPPVRDVTCTRPPRSARSEATSSLSVRPAGTSPLETPRCGARPLHDLPASPSPLRRRRARPPATAASDRRARAIAELDEAPGPTSTACPPATAGPPGTSRRRTGPRPHPAGWSPSLAAVDTELGVLKTGKEADVFLLERAVPGTRPALPARRQALPRPPSTGCSTATPATSRAAGSRSPARPGRWPRRTAFGRELLAGQWAAAEFAALARLWARRASPVPYPVQIDGTELLMEFVGDADGTAAPAAGPAAARRRPSCADLWRPAGATRCAVLARARPGRTATCRRTTCWSHRRRPAGDHRPAAGRRPGRQPAGAGVPRPRRARVAELVRRARAAAPASQRRAARRHRPLSCAFPSRPTRPHDVTALEGHTVRQTVPASSDGRGSGYDPSTSAPAVTAEESVVAGAAYTPKGRHRAPGLVSNDFQCRRQGAATSSRDVPRPGGTSCLPLRSPCPAPGERLVVAPPLGRRSTPLLPRVPQPRCLRTGSRPGDAHEVLWTVPETGMPVLRRARPARAARRARWPRDGITAPFPIQAATIPTPSPAATSSAAARPAPARRCLRPARCSPASPAHAGPARSARAALILVPTRELAMQVSDALEPLGARRSACVTSSSSAACRTSRRSSALHRGVDVLVATPGRLTTSSSAAPATCGDRDHASSTRPTTWPTWASCPRSPRSST